MVVLALLDIKLKNLFLSDTFLGKKPINKKLLVGNPLDIKPVKAAQGPGEQITSKLFSLTFLTKYSPGSHMLGIPASLTKATDLPECRKLIIFPVLL